MQVTNSGKKGGEVRYGILHDKGVDFVSGIPGIKKISLMDSMGIALDPWYILVLFSDKQPFV